MSKKQMILIEAAFLLFIFSSSQADPPSLTTEKSVNPTVIYLKDTGAPDEATVTLTVTGIGEPQSEVFPIDVVLVMDKSGSMAGQMMDDAKAAAIYFCSLLDFYLDKSSLVSFSSSASLDQMLISYHFLTAQAIIRLEAGGGTAIGSGIHLAQEELISTRHRPEAEPVMLVLSDGDNNQGLDPVIEADSAKAQGSIIYCIGLGPSVNEVLLKEIASDPDSEYYFYAPASEDLDSIYGRIHEELSNLAAREVYATEILAENIDYVPGSFSVAPIRISGDSASWDIGSLSIGENWVVTFNITADDTGHLPVDDYPNAEVTFLNYLGYSESVAFPQAYIDVLLGTGVEEDGVRGEGSKMFLKVSPNPFHSSTTIRYQIPEGVGARRVVPVHLAIYDITGRLVETLVGEPQKPGVYQLPITSHQLPGSGVYFYRLTARIGQPLLQKIQYKEARIGQDSSSPYTATKKLILLR